VKVYVVGRGAVGGYLGDLLAGIGVDVVYAPRSIDAVEPYDADVAIVAVKAYDTDDAIATLRRVLGDAPSAAIVTPQNGVGNEEKLAEAFGAKNVVAAALTVPVDRDRDGHSSATKEGGLAFAPVGESAFNWLVATFASTGLKVSVVDDWRALKWSKLALNVMANASCAILNVLPAREDLHAGDPDDSGGARGDEGDAVDADRPAALSGTRALRHDIDAECACQGDPLRQYRARPRYEATLAAARLACGKAA